MATNDIVIIPTTAHPILAQNIVSHSSFDFHVNFFDIEESIFANGETNIKLKTSVRGKNAYIISTGAGDVNTNLLNSIFIARACKRSAANSITLIYGAFPYARSDKKDHRGTISASDIAHMIETAGVNRVITFDLHSGQIQGFFHDIPCDNIYSIIPLAEAFISMICKESDECTNSNSISRNYVNKIDSVQYISILSFFNIYSLTDFADYNKIIQEQINTNYILCSPDAGGIKRVEAWANILKIDYVVMHKQRDYKTQNKISSTKLIGDPASLVNKTIILVDDMADTMGTMCATIDELTKYNIKNCIIIVTHGYFSAQALDKINKHDKIKYVICTNTIDQSENMTKCSKIKVVDLSGLIFNVIQRIETHPKQSLSELFTY